MYESFSHICFFMANLSLPYTQGKCSHGGAADLTSTVVPRGGISKDERRPDNEAFHTAAVKLATSASLQLLEDIRGAAGDNDFLRCNDNGLHNIITIRTNANDMSVYV